MIIIISILIFLASIMLIGVVLIQKSKGGGLAAGFSGYNQLGGVRKTTDFIEKLTWGLAIFICVLSIATPFIQQPTTVVANKKITLEDMKTQKDQQAPQFPSSQNAAPASNGDQKAPAAAPAQQAPAEKK